MRIFYTNKNNYSDSGKTNNHEIFYASISMKMSIKFVKSSLYDPRNCENTISEISY